MIVLKATLGFACLIFFIIGAFNGSLFVVDRVGMHGRLASAVLCMMLSFASLVCYFKVPTI